MNLCFTAALAACGAALWRYGVTAPLLWLTLGTAALWALVADAHAADGYDIDLSEDDKNT